MKKLCSKCIGDKEIELSLNLGECDECGRIEIVAEVEDDSDN